MLTIITVLLIGLGAMFGRWMYAQKKNVYTCIDTGNTVLMGIVFVVVGFLASLFIPAEVTETKTTYNVQTVGYESELTGGHFLGIGKIRETQYFTYYLEKDNSFSLQFAPVKNSTINVSADRSTVEITTYTVKTVGWGIVPHTPDKYDFFLSRNSSLIDKTLENIDRH